LSGRPEAPSAIRSTPHARLAISSRRNSTSSSGAPSIVRFRVGARKRLVGASALPLFLNIRQWLEAGWADRSIDGISVRTPKVSVITSELIRQIEPTGTSTGMTNQSLP